MTAFGRANMSRRIDWVKFIYNYLKTTTKWEQHMKHVKNISLNDHGIARAEFEVTKDHVNSDGSLPIGLATTLLDVTSSWALVVHGKGFSGISTNIHAKNLKPAFPGDVLVINAKVFNLEEPLAYIEVEMSKKNTDEIVFRGQQTMVVTKSTPVDYKPTV